MIAGHHENKDGRVVISPSSIGTWFNDSAAWYRRQVLGQNTFKGNTSTTIGHISHWKANCVTNNREFRDDDVERLLQENIFNTDIEADVVRNEYKEMTEVMADYLASNPLDRSEEYMEYVLDDYVKVAGTADGFRGKTVVDFKTTKQYPYRGMKPEHFYQALIYAWLKKKTQNRDIDKVQIVYLKRPNSKSAAGYSVFEQDITEADWAYIEKLIYEIDKAILLVKEKPELVPIVFRDNPTSFYGKE